MRSWPIMPVHLKNLICTFTFSYNPLLTLPMIAKVNMYVYLKFGCNWATNMKDMAKVHFSNSSTASSCSVSNPVSQKP